MTDEGTIHEISRALGRLEAGQQAIDARIAANHEDAAKEWDRVAAELRNVKHEQRNTQQMAEGTVRGLSSLKDEVKRSDAHLSSVDTHLTKVDSRLSAIETLGYKVTLYATFGATVTAAAVQIFIHYGGWLLKTVGLKS